MHTPEDFQLQLAATEDSFAEKLIICFEPLCSYKAVEFIRGAGGVDLLNDVFGRFLADSFVEEKQLGQYLTPVEVVRFMVQLGIHSVDRETLDDILDVRKCSEAGVILDPSCGVGSFLAESLRVLSHRVKDRFGQEVLAPWIRAVTQHCIVGIDKSERMIKLALTNLALFGAKAQIV